MKLYSLTLLIVLCILTSSISRGEKCTADQKTCEISSNKRSPGFFNKLFKLFVRWLVSTPFGARNAKAPGSGFIGKLLSVMMEETNAKSIRHAVERLKAVPGNSDILLEIGAAHGTGIKAFSSFNPKRLIAMDISPRFRQILSKLNIPNLEIYSDDAKDMSGFLESNSVDRLLAMNVVYFLDPLPEYAREIKRILKKDTGIGLLGCKLQLISSGNNAYFKNKSLADIRSVFEQEGFLVEEENMDLGSPSYNYVALIIRHNSPEISSETERERERENADERERERENVDESGRERENVDESEREKENIDESERERENLDESERERENVEERERERENERESEQKDL